jgi:hypothetical protein
MNESQLTALLSRAGERLDPDVSSLVAGGTRRGRRRRRRSAAALALGTAAVVTLGGGVAWQAGPRGADRVAQDPNVATSPSTPSTQDSQRALPPADVLAQRLLDHLPDGEVREVTTTPTFDGPDAPYERGVEISLLLDGAAVEVRVSDGSIDPEAWARQLDPGPLPEGCDASLVDADEDTWRQAIQHAAGTATEVTGVDRDHLEEPPLLSPAQACVSWVSVKREQKCAASPQCLAKRTAYSPERICGPDGHRLPDGSWLWPRSGDGGDGSDTSGFQGNWASLCRSDGWVVDVSAFNSPDPDGGAKVTGEEPVLGLQQVTDLATAAFWFS